MASSMPIEMETTNSKKSGNCFRRQARSLARSRIVKPVGALNSADGRGNDSSIEPVSARQANRSLRNAMQLSSETVLGGQRLKAVTAVEDRQSLSQLVFFCTLRAHVPDTSATFAETENRVISICSSVGRALHSHCRGQGFESPQLHHAVGKSLGNLRLQEINGLVSPGVTHA